jgi:arginine decarboxylase
MKNKQLNTLLRPELAQAGGFQKNLVVGNRIPRDYFVTTGSGESDITVHAGSYHLALKSAGIEMANIMTYSSILPGIANELPKPAHIMAVANGTKGEQLNAGIIFGWLHDRYSNEKFGGLVCEHNGNYSDEEIRFKLRESLNELYTNGFEEQYALGDVRLITQSCRPEKNFGTALVALCFTSYVYPVLDYPSN